MIRNGASYIQFISRAQSTDNQGILIEIVRANYKHFWD